MFNQILDTLFEDKHFFGDNWVHQNWPVCKFRIASTSLYVCVYIRIYIYIDICALQVETLSRYAMGYLEDHPS